MQVPSRPVARPAAFEVEATSASSVGPAVVDEPGPLHHVAVEIPAAILEEVAGHYAKGGWMWEDAGEQYRALKEAEEAASCALADEVFLRKGEAMKAEGDREAIEPRSSPEDIDMSSKFAFVFNFLDYFYANHCSSAVR